MALTKVIGDGVGVLTTADEGKLKIQTGTTSASYLSFADGDNNRGYVKYDHNNDSLELGVAGESHFKIDSAHILTMDKQPAFLVHPSSDQLNIAASASAVTVVFGTERFDQNGDFASNTFTAPVTGRYQLNASIYLNNVDSASNYVYMAINTSNMESYFIIDPDFGQDSVYWSITGSILADMDANDTAFIQIVQETSTVQMDINQNSRFSGYLVA
jgi:hypothetical protein